MCVYSALFGRSLILYWAGNVAQIKTVLFIPNKVAKKDRCCNFLGESYKNIGNLN